MTGNRLVVFAALVSMLVAAGCTSHRVLVDRSKEEEQKNEKKLPLQQYESSLRPSDYDREIEITPKIYSDNVERLDPMEIPRDTIIIKEETVQGFRIQVFSSSGVDEANLIKSLVQEKFPKDSVYVEYDAPVYKVRVGDFLNRYEANQRLPEFVSRGYRDAWIVPERIIQRKLERVPLPR
jgi:hypothetical protein